jgi:hypothetical protein
MSLVSVFVDAFKKAAGRKPKIDIEEVRSTGGLGPSNPTDAFDPMRTAPPPGSGSDVTRGDLSVSSGDPEEGGEVSAPDGPTTT